jgi:hypothetical protein
MVRCWIVKNQELKTKIRASGASKIQASKYSDINYVIMSPQYWLFSIKLTFYNQKTVGTQFDK